MMNEILEILVAEDSKTTCQILQAQLEEWGYHVVVANDGNTAWEMLQSQNPPRIALIDWFMPGMDGIELCRQLKAYEGVPYTYIILISALASSLQKEDIILAGADDVLFKPIDPHELKLRLHVAKRVIHYDNMIKNKNQVLLERNQQLTELDHFKNKLLGIVSHDLRNPIVSIRGISELFLKDILGPLTQEQKSDIKMIHSVSDNMLKLVNDLLDVSVIESGILELHSQDADLNAIVKNRIVMLGIIAKQKDIELIFKPASLLPPLKCDPSRMGQVVDNLVSNAVKFSNRNTCVIIETSHSSTEVFLSVKDQGPGIKEDDLKKLFGEFQKLQNRPTGGESSTGIGLALTKKIIQLHKGKIEVETEVGKGSIFKVFLPVSP